MMDDFHSMLRFVQNICFDEYDLIELRERGGLFDASIACIGDVRDTSPLFTDEVFGSQIG